MAYSNTVADHRPGLGERLGMFVRHVQDVRAREAVRRRTHRELSELSDRDLADLGVHRSMIGQLAHEAAYKN